MLLLSSRVYAPLVPAGFNGFAQAANFSLSSVASPCDDASCEAWIYIVEGKLTDGKTYGSCENLNLRPLRNVYRSRRTENSAVDLWISFIISQILCKVLENLNWFFVIFFFSLRLHRFSRYYNVDKKTFWISIFFNVHAEAEAFSILNSTEREIIINVGDTIYNEDVWKFANFNWFT